MNSTQLGLRVAGTIFGVVSVGHLARILLQIQVMLGGHPVPVWLSGGGFVAAGFLCFWLWGLSLPARPAARSL